MIKSDLLKSAIIDAKAVRATALANASAALKEAFAPRFEAMFAEKLKEESEEEDQEEEQEESMMEVEAPNQVDDSGGEAKAPKTKAVSKGNPKTPKNRTGDMDFKPVKAGCGPTDVSNPTKKVNETAEEEEEEEEEEQEESMKNMDEAGLTSEDLDEIIKELEDEVKDSNTTIDNNMDTDGDNNPSPEEVDVDAEPGSDVNVDAEPGSDVSVDSDSPDSEVDIDLGGNDTTNTMSKNGGDDSVSAMEKPQEEEEEDQEEEEEQDEEVNLDELLNALNEESEEEEEEEDESKMDESSLKNQGVPTNDLQGQDKKAGVKGYAKQTSNKWIESGGKNHKIKNGGVKGNIGTPDGVGKPMAEQYKIALKESYKTIEYLRGQINEVNLLNAKLLYTNKLFKEFGPVLDDSYRMKIVESFDLTKSVREVKLAYALLAESLNFGTQVRLVEKVSNNVSLKQNSSTKNQKVKQITEGFASKPVSSTKPSQLITEGSAMALRFKKLAGIKDVPKIISENKK